jgi:Kelch motif protein
VLATLALALAPASAHAADVGRFTPLAATLGADRAGAVAAPLPGGRVLVAAGFRTGPGFLATAEIFDPASSTFQPVTSTLTVARTRAAAATLKDGRVLIVGGAFGSTPEKTAEMFDPATNTFSPLTGHDMTRARSGPIAATLPDGRVLVAGGEEAGSESSAEVFDPATSTFTALGAQMKSARSDGRAAPLADGRILITGGRGQNKVPQFTAEVFDPGTGQFSYVADMAKRRFRHVAAPLPDGRVLVAGGTDETLRQLASAEVYDPAADRWDPVTGNGGEMTTVRHGGVAAPLADGRVLIAGGFEDIQSLGSAELFEGAPDPVVGGDGAFGDQSVGTTSAPRALTVTNRNAATLDVGRVSFEGGDGDFALASDGCAGAQLGLGQSCTVLVTFSPSDLGPRTAQLAVLDNAPSRVQRLALEGAGVPATPVGPTGGGARPDLSHDGGTARRAAVACLVVKRSGRRRLACLATSAPWRTARSAARGSGSAGGARCARAAIPCARRSRRAAGRSP